MRTGGGELTFQGAVDSAVECFFRSYAPAHTPPAIEAAAIEAATTAATLACAARKTSVRQPAEGQVEAHWRCAFAATTKSLKAAFPRAAVGVQARGSVELSDYEVARAARIADNTLVLRALGITRLRTGGTL